MDKSDFDLIKDIKNGEKEAFNMLMQKYQHFVYSIAYGFGKTKENAMDITQNVFLKIYQNLDTFRGDSQFKTWLTRITHNESLNWMQKHSRHQNHDSPQEVELQIQETINQEAELMAVENRTELLRSLYQLNTKYRLAIVLRYFEEMPVAQIALSLNCSEGVVKNMLFRSIRKLRETMVNPGEEN